MACSKHPLRKRKECPECQGLKPNLDIKEREFSKQSKPITIGNKKTINEIPNPEITIKHFVHKEPEIIEPEITLKEVKSEGDKIANYIDKIINDRIGNIKRELASFSSIRWEHLIVPSSVFNTDLMLKLEKDGWSFCQIVSNTKEFQYNLDSSSGAVFKRVISSSNKMAPIFKRGK